MERVVLKIHENSCFFVFSKNMKNTFFYIVPGILEGAQERSRKGLVTLLPMVLRFFVPKQKDEKNKKFHEIL